MEKMKSKTQRVQKRKSVILNQSYRWFGVPMVLCLLFAPSSSFAQRKPIPDDPILLELFAMGRGGNEVVRARGEVLEILSEDNACSAWFREVQPDAADVFQSLHFVTEDDGVSTVYARWEPQTGMLYKQPWAARSTQSFGRDAVIELNANGAFFLSSSPLRVLKDNFGISARRGSTFPLAIDLYRGNSQEAQITILLHELGHVTGRLPEDSDSWDRKSVRNTAEVMRHCRASMKTAVHHSAKGGGGTFISQGVPTSRTIVETRNAFTKTRE
jgi:hypothetical protein